MATETRVTVQFSVGGAGNAGAFRTSLVNKLEKAGFSKGISSDSWEHAGISPAELGRTMSGFWEMASTHKGPGQIEDFWMYANRERSKNSK